jgi:N-acyl-D-amino-acid deacylase
VLSHHKCAGVRNWGRAAETLGLIDAARQTQPIHLDCYPYTAGSTVIRPDLADGEIEILINWSTPHPEMAGRTLKSIAEEWGITQTDAAERLMPWLPLPVAFNHRHHLAYRRGKVSACASLRNAGSH